MREELGLELRDHSLGMRRYFGECIRLYTHYAFREAVKWAMEKEELTVAQHQVKSRKPLRSLLSPNRHDPASTTASSLERANLQLRPRGLAG